MNEAADRPIRFGELQFDPARGLAFRDGVPVLLSDPAARVLGAFANRPEDEVPVADLCASTHLDADQIAAAAQELSGLLGDRCEFYIDGQSLRLTHDDSLYGFLEELRNRKVFRVATGYAISGWLLLQVAEIVFPLVHLDGTAMRVLLITILVGFPVAVAAAWALELTPGGLVLDWRRARRSGRAELDERKIDRFIIAALVLVIAVLVLRVWTDNIETAAPLRVVAVLPFQTTSTDATGISLCEGFAEEIRVGLDRLPGIRVAAREMSAALSGAERDKEVEWLVQGSCQLVSDALNVKVSLVETKTGLQRWAYSDSRHFDQLLSFQDDIAATLAFELSVPEEALRAAHEAQTTDPRAYRLYLQARGYLSRPNQADSLGTAAELFANAIRQDEEFAAAHAGLCEAGLAQYLRTHDTAQERQAESACLRASQLGPGLPEVHIALGRLFLETGDHGAAERALRKARELKPDSVAATRELANVLSAQNRPAQAESLYREAIAIPAGSWRAHHDYGRFLLRRGRLEDAVRQFEEVVGLTPDNAPAYNNLGATYLQMGRIGDAAVNFEQVAEIEPIASSISNYGTMLYYEGQYAAAETQFRRAAEMSPADHRMRGNVADAVYHIEGRQADALVEYRAATVLAEKHLEVSRKDAQALAAEAWYRARSGESETAAAHIREALEISPGNPEVLYYAALVSLEAGDHSSARESLAQAAAAGYPQFLLNASPDLRPLLELAAPKLPAGAADTPDNP